jgi:tetratricopeptide (TPR) repeat protein
MSSAEALKAKEDGNKALASKDTNAAIAHFARGIDLLSSSASSLSDADVELKSVLLSNRSAAFAALRQWSAALADAEAAAALRPSWSKAHARAGLALYHLLRGEDSLRAYQKAAQLEPANAALQENVAQAQQLVRAIEFTVLGEQFMAKKNYVAATDHFRQSCELAPHAALFWSNKSHANSMRGAFADAIADADQAIRVQPDWHRGYQRKAEALSAEHKFDDALQFFATAIQLAPDTPSLKQEFAQCQQEAMNARRREQYMKAAAAQKAKEESAAEPAAAQPTSQ